MTRDPLTRYKQWLLAKQLVSESELATVESETQAAVQASVEFARQSADPDPEAGVLNTHAQGPVAATQFYNRKGLVTAGRRTT
jgi:TPP-dependent pyruvate/acetoin dehydrogenase alpha subunit